MDSASVIAKHAPSHPFTKSDVEVMRGMRVRLTHRKFGIIIALQTVLSLLVGFWAVYVVASCTLPICVRFKWMNDWIVLASLLLAIVNIAGIVVTVKRYRAALRFLRDPATHPDLIISGETMSCDSLKTISSSIKKSAP
ncbi:hypothetical protein H4R20_001506 [Coemansia guatemalensis]|uniref:Uncharacterized protein n=1 Tax=Coemansia guatemalensis TaxID=2761395 RepID=A0A9W8HXA5_9FUNG|nr:hypothetical protein H4R20_001506 [Coemansia guatemalensis]